MRTKVQLSAVDMHFYCDLEGLMHCYKSVLLGTYGEVLFNPCVPSVHVSTEFFQPEQCIFVRGIGISFLSVCTCVR